MQILSNMFVLPWLSISSRLLSRRRLADSNRQVAIRARGPCRNARGGARTGVGNTESLIGRFLPGRAQALNLIQSALIGGCCRLRQAWFQTSQRCDGCCGVREERQTSAMNAMRGLGSEGARLVREGVVLLGMQRMPVGSGWMIARGVRGRFGFALGGDGGARVASDSLRMKGAQGR